MLGLEDAAHGDEVFRHLVLARIIERVSKLDSMQVLEEAGLRGVSYRTVAHRLPAYAKEKWRQRLSEACAAHAGLGPASLVLHDVSTLYFETVPVIEKFMAAHRLPDVTVAADAGMISETNQTAIEAAGLSFILGMKIPDVP